MSPTSPTGDYRMLQGDAEFASHSWEGLSTGSIDSVRKNCKTPPGPGSLRGNGWLGVGYAVGETES